MTSWVEHQWVLQGFSIATTWRACPCWRPSWVVDHFCSTNGQIPGGQCPLQLSCNMLGWCEYWILNDLSSIECNHIHGQGGKGQWIQGQCCHHICQGLAMGGVAQGVSLFLICSFGNCHPKECKIFQDQSTCWANNKCCVGRCRICQLQNGLMSHVPDDTGFHGGPLHKE